jgi:autotransporter-associated beta strand protein
VDLNGVRTWTVDDSTAADVDLTVTSVIQNSGTPGTFTKNGLGRLVLSGANTFADVFAVGDGVVRIQHASALGSTAGGTTINSGDALEIAGGITVSGESLLVAGGGPSSTGALRSVTGINAWTGVINLGADSRIHADAGSKLTVSAIVAGGTFRDVTFGGDGDIVASGRIGSGDVSPVDQVLKDGTGTLTLENTGNDFTGTVTVNNGILKLGASQVIPDVENVTVNRGTFELNGMTENIAALTLGSSTTTLAGATPGIIDTVGGGLLRLGGSVAYNAGSTGFENGQASISASLDLNNASRTISVADNPTLDVEVVISSVISNSGATAAGIVKDGAGTLILSGANTYNNTSTIRNGTMRLGADEVLPSGFGLTLDQRAAGTSTLDLNGHVETIGGTLTLGSNSTTVAGSVNQIIDSAGGGVLRLGGGITYNIGAATFHNATSNISANLDLNGATRTFTVNDSANAANDVVISGVISNSGGSASGIAKSGTGTLVLTGANSYDGNTAVNAGVLRAANNSALGTLGTVTLANTDAALELAQGVTISRALTVSDSGNNKTLRLQDGATAATYAGNVAISEATAGNFDVSASSGGTLTLSGVISGTAAAGVSKEGEGTAALSGANTYTGATNVNAGTLQVGAAGVGQTGTGALSVASGANLVGTGIVRSSSVILSAGSTLAAGDSAAVSSHGTLVFTPASASGTVHDLQGSIVLSLTSATLEDGNFGGHEVGSTGYQAWVDAVVGAGSHDLLVFNNPAAGTGYTLNFLSTTGALQVVPSSFTARSGQVFNLLDWSGMVTTNFSGFSFNSGYLVGNDDEGADLDLPDLTGTGLFWDTSRLIISGNIAIVPEPSRVFLILLGFAAMILRRCRRL